MKVPTLICCLVLLPLLLWAEESTPKNDLLAVAKSAAGRTGEQINWQVISSGGTDDASSTNFRLSGTVGQTAVGEGSSTNYGMRHGYWQDFGGGAGCCNHDGIRGDENYDMQGPNIVDLTYLVAYLFGGGAPPPCEEEGDVNADGGTNIVDLTALVAYLFGGGSPPEPCP